MKKWGLVLWIFLKKHRWSVLLVLLSLFVAGFILWDSFSASVDGPKMGKLRPKPAPTTVMAPISGLQVAPDLASKKPIAVVVENHPDARPQSGLNKADLVYETFAEGGITRFLAVFQSQEPKEIGPVRSARPYFVQWAAGYKAIFAHVGGSVDAIRLIPKTTVYDINQFYNGKYFWRDPNKYAPHNVFTTMTKLFSAAHSHNYPITDSSVPSFSFKKEPATKDRPVSSAFTVRFNGPFAVTWSYDPKTNKYTRSMSGITQTDSVTKEQIKASNVLVGFSEFSYGVNSDGAQKVDIRTTGSGSAQYYIDGKKNLGTWKRLTSSDILRFYDSAGSEVKLNPGTTWIEFAPVGTAVN